MAIHPQAEDAVEKVIYVWNMLDHSSRHLEESYDRVDKPSKNILLESFLMYTRVLFYFFKRPAKQGDVIAAHFFSDDSQWAAKSANLCPYISSMMDDVHKRLAHLTYARTGPKVSWDTPTMWSELDQARRDFLDALDAEQRHWFDQAKERLDRS